MNNNELDTLLAQPLPERDAGAFSVALMERIAHHQARPARIAAWIMAGLLTIVITAAMVLLAQFTGRAQGALPIAALPGLLLLLSLLLSFAVMTAARE